MSLETLAWAVLFVLLGLIWLSAVLNVLGVAFGWWRRVGKTDMVGALRHWLKR